MINITKGLTQNIYFTGTENAVLTNPFFLFIFTHRMTLEDVKIMVTNTSVTDRYDLFSLISNSYFSESTEGLWGYKVYEKLLITDLTESGNIVELGFMNLNPTTAFSPVEYSSQDNNFTTYAGQ